MSSLVLDVDVGHRGRIDLEVAVSIPLELVPPDQDSSACISGIGIVDTGAQLTLVCEQILRELQALPYGSCIIVGVNGQPRDSDTYLVDLHFIYGGQTAWTIKRLEVAPLENSENTQVLIGMEVLTKHVHEFRLTGSKALISF